MSWTGDPTVTFADGASLVLLDPRRRDQRRASRLSRTVWSRTSQGWLGFPALGTIIAYDNLTSKVSILQNLYTNAIPAAIVIACVYIPLNLGLAWAATRLERRNRRRRITAPAAIGAEPEMQRGGKVETVTRQG